MKRLTLPAQPDAEILDALSQNHHLGSYPFLLNQLGEMKQRYVDYANVGGDPWTVGDALNIPEELVAAMKRHYDTPPQALPFLSELREDGSPDVCSMCGSLKTGTLDHFLPKDKFPEFAIYAPNLVPACDCNIKRRTNYKGKLVGQRALHPYFDEILSRRLAFVQFSGNLASPLVEIAVIDEGLNAEQALALSFHVVSVLDASSLIVWASAKWAALCRDPEGILFGLPREMLTVEHIRDALRVRLNGADREYGTPNNWYSMTFYGVLQSHEALSHIHGRVLEERGGVNLSI
jgi:hypothetical protein